MEISVWLITLLNAVLVFILGLLLKPIVGHITGLIKEVKEYRKDVKEFKKTIETDIITRFESSVCKIHSLESNLWREINKLRRSVAMSTLVIRRRRAETVEILEDQERSKSRLGNLEKLAKAGVKISKSFNKRLIDTDTRVIQVTKDLKIFKSNGSDGK